MNRLNKAALTKAHSMAETIEAFMQVGNLEMAHRASQVYTALLLTVMMTELVPEAAKLWEELDRKKKTPVTADGTIVQ